MTSESSAVDYNAVLADLEARRAQLDAMIAGVQYILGQGAAPGISSPPGPASVQNGEIPSDAFFGLSIPDATKKFLAMRKRTATTPEVIQALSRGGQVNASSSKFGNTVGSVLARADANGAGIVRVSRGTWGLAEWYPNRARKSAGKTGSNGNGDEEKSE